MFFVQEDASQEYYDCHCAAWYQRCTMCYYLAVVSLCIASTLSYGNRILTKFDYIELDTGIRVHVDECAYIFGGTLMTTFLVCPV